LKYILILFLSFLVTAFLDYVWLVLFGHLAVEDPFYTRGWLLAIFIIVGMIHKEMVK